MKTVYELSKELNAGLIDLYKDAGFDALCQELTQRVANMKAEILTAWFAEHGFEPGKAVIVEEHTMSGHKIYIRERTAEEAERASHAAVEQQADIHRQAQPAICPLHVPGNVCRWGHGYICGASPCSECQ